MEEMIANTFKSDKNNVFLNFHDPHKGYFVAVIFAGDLKNFPFDPAVFYNGKEVRITGLIETYEGDPEIVVNTPSQIEVAYMGLNYTVVQSSPSENVRSSHYGVDLSPFPMVMLPPVRKQTDRRS